MRRFHEIIQCELCWGKIEKYNPFLVWNERFNFGVTPAVEAFSCRPGWGLRGILGPTPWLALPSGAGHGGLWTVPSASIGFRWLLGEECRSSSEEQFPGGPLGTLLPQKLPMENICASPVPKKGGEQARVS